MAKANLGKLKRKQVDELLAPYVDVPIRYPKPGWLRTLRVALGMTMSQLGARLGGTSKQAVEQFEKNEVDGSITLTKLRSVAEALDCELLIVVRPRAGSVENAVTQQATRKARGINADVLHTMALEAQTDGIEDNPDLSSEIHWWLTQNSARLWD